MKNSNATELSSHVSPSTHSAPSTQPPAAVAPEESVSGRNDIMWGRMVLALVLSGLIIGAALVADAWL